MTRHRLCAVAELAEAQARQFALPLAERSLDVFVVKWRGHLYAYINSCPHTGAGLNWVPHEFFDPDYQHLQCATHGALFRPDDGVCVWGPCAGQALSPVAVEIEDGLAYACI
ncbi:MAG TPA: Rieske 2Fe-2S domain-containing protein [Gammaproteobacteria bacterium]|nr:Rieske 2Fe-2S domain-containing protein [Gammaproteobacteria bacterium]